MRSVELFTGVGGLGMAVSNAGFEHLAVVEWDRNACRTIRGNQQLWVEPVHRWPLFEADVRDFDYSVIDEPVDLLAGGPPCQPFSLGGKHRAHTDPRDMFPEVARAVRELKPKAVMVENVKGLLRESFADYFEYVVLRIRFPEIEQREDESWTDHLGRLEQHQTHGKYLGLHYNVIFRLLNAADYGVPQRRERVFIVAFRGDLGIEWSFPEPSHSQDSLLYSQWVLGDYWDRHGVASTERPTLPARLGSRVPQLRDQLVVTDDKPWLTVRDALCDLPDPRNDHESRLVANHAFARGARAYTGHTGSPLDEPAKTLKAGDHGVPGGENMLAYADGSVRYFTVRESARLQTFPDTFVFPGSWTESMRQLGNAVPVTLGSAVANKIVAALEERGRRDRNTS